MTTEPSRRRRACVDSLGVTPARRLVPRISTTSEDASIENCQVGVLLAYASRYGRTSIDRALYLPESWAADWARRAEAGIPEAIAFATKPKLGLAMLEHARGARLPFAWVTADSVYGSDHALRRWLREWGLGYVLAVTRAQRLSLTRVEARVAEIPADLWQRLSCKGFDLT